MSPFPRFLLVAFACLAGVVPALAQTPRVYLKIDNTNPGLNPPLKDYSSAGIITSVTATGFAPSYTTDRNGAANQALVVPGNASLQLIASTLLNNSNQALGLRNAGGTNTSFTLTAWVYFNSVSGQGYNTIFGNTGAGAGTLHAGLNNNSAFAHFGFDGNDVNGVTAAMVGAQWFHLAFVYDASGAGTQRIYVNGVPETQRFTVNNTLKVADLFLGNWGTATDVNNDLEGRLDEVAVFNAVLNAGQIQALFNGVDANSLPATYSGPKLPGYTGTAGMWGVREIKGYPGISYGTLVNADRIVRAYAAAPGGTVAEYFAPVINHIDPEGAGTVGYFPSEANFGTNTAGPDDSILMVAKCAVRIPTAGNYTFGFRGDDGSRLRILGKQFASSTRIGVGNVDPAHHGDGIHFINGTGDSNTLGVVNLTPGDYNLELVWWEGGGGSSIEVFAAPGAKTSVDSAFQLIGNTAAGGLEIVRDPDNVPTFTVDGGSSLFVHSGVPASFTLAWNVVNPATSLSIDQGIGAVPDSGSQAINSPAVTTTYTITATTGADVSTKSVTVHVNAPPVMTFTANDTTVVSGAAVTLSWVVDGAVTLTLQPGSINVTGQTSRVVNPAVDTTYTLQATNPAGTTSQSILIDVGAPPAINSFTVADQDPLFGAETTLAWNVAGADTLSINQGIGAISGATGSIGIAPIQTTTYTLTATNVYAAATATATVNQPTPIGVAAPGFTARRVNASTPFPFANQGYLQSADSLIGGQNLLSETTQAGYATVNFSDGADGDFTAGNSLFPGAVGGDNFAVRITATLVVNTPGEYRFILNSDDGGRLRIDGKDVIVDDATHAPSSNSGSVTLTNPTAQLEIIYYDATGGAEVELGWIRPNLSFQILTTITPAPAIVRGQVLISEFVADNTQLLDEDGASSDWIEIWNSTLSPVNLSTYFLTDDPALPNKWQFPTLPAWTLAPNQYLLVFASLKDRRPAQAVAGQDNPGTLAQPHLHANFKLSKTGGYLALNQSNGMGGYNPITVFAAYPPQREDIGYGSSDSEGYVGFTITPTAGQRNGATVTDFVADTTFSHPRGRYSAPFSLTIATATPGATIRYTTDGSTPTLNFGNIYTAPIPITGTKVVRAAAFKPGWQGTNVDTQSYLFIDDIVTQTAATATALGFPSGSVNGQVFRYGMALLPVTNGGGTLQSLKSALAAAPTVCMTTDIGNLVNVSTGIYVNPGQHGLEWERPVSIEYLNAAGTSEFQIDCGARIRGGFSRATNNPKHAFHLYFRGSLYDGDLKYRLFGTAGAAQFEQLDMRCEQNNSWSFQNSGANVLMREEWSRVTQRDMGQPYARTDYFHLYINGIYWGIFNWEERTEASYGATYLGGEKDTQDVVKSAGSSGGYNTEMTDGNFAAWQTLYNLSVALKNDATEAGRTAKLMQMQGLNPDGTPNAAYPVLLDLDNLIDYNLVVFYDGSFDSPLSTFLSNGSNNWFGVRDRLGSRGFAFFAHDHEHGMDSAVQSYNRVGPWGDPTATGNNWGQTWTTAQYRTRETFTKSNPQYTHELLAFSAEYRQRFADRVQRHFFNGGALTTAKSAARLAALAAQVDPVIHAEAARWGSASLHRGTWVTAKTVVENFINNGGTSQAGQTVFAVQPRTSMVIEQLRGYQDPIGVSKALFPAATQSAPVFSGAFGGAVMSPHNFNITNPNAAGAIFYTTNGADPRPIGGGAPIVGAITGASPLAVSLTTTSTVKARIYNSATLTWSPLTEAEYLVGALASSSNLVISKIHYNPPGGSNLTQFMEVMNISAQTIDLTNVRFTIGVQFQFPDAYTLAPGARALIVRDLAAFQAAYPSVPVGQIVGVFANGTTLDTNGELLLLIDSTNADLRNFSYDNNAPWPESPDGNGPSLVLLHPTTNPAHGTASNWRASASSTGSPGVNDAVSYANWSIAFGLTGNLNADDDGDGSTNLAEYYLGTDPHAATAAPLQSIQTLNVGGIVSNYLTLTFTRTLGRDDASAGVQYSAVLTAPSWSAAILVGTPTYNGNGTETLTYRYPAAVPAPPVNGTRQFLRLRITQP